MRLANTMKSRDTHSIDTRRRCVAAGLGLPALAWTGALRAQAKPPVIIGWLSANSREITGPSAFNEGMAALGWKLGAQYLLEEPYADGRVDRLPGLAQELAAKKPAVIVAQPSRSARAVATAAPTTPIVLAEGDPISTGLVTNLARPGGMITGLSNVVSDLNQKMVELLVECLPKSPRIGFLTDSATAAHGVNVNNVRRAAERLRFEAFIVDMSKPEDIEPAVARLAKDKVQALVILSSSWFRTYHAKIMQLALAQRWPIVGLGSEVPRQGGLLSYGFDDDGRSRRVAYFVDRILKGAKPGDLAIEQPTTFHMVLNLKTAKALGIVIPPSVLVRATLVIE